MPRTAPPVSVVYNAVIHNDRGRIVLRDKTYTVDFYPSKRLNSGSGEYSRFDLEQVRDLLNAALKVVT
jgi:hypothetical protein